MGNDDRVTEEKGLKVCKRRAPSSLLCMESHLIHPDLLEGGLQSLEVGDELMLKLRAPLDALEGNNTCSIKQ